MAPINSFGEQQDMYETLETKGSVEKHKGWASLLQVGEFYSPANTGESKSWEKGGMPTTSQ